MSAPAAEISLVPLPRIDASALPTYFRGRMESRARERASAWSELWEHGYPAVFFGFVAAVCGFIAWATLLTNVGASAIFMAFCAGSGAICAIEGWKTAERASYLYGTRDESRYLPPGCRAYAEKEATLFLAAAEVDAAAARWNEALPLLEEHGTPELRGIAAIQRGIIDKRISVIAGQSARLFVAAAQSEDPVPKALPAPAKP